MNLKKIDKKLYKYIVIASSVMALVIVFILVVSIMSGGRVSYSAAESKIKAAAISYYAAREDELPIVGESVTLSIDTLVEAEKIKSLDKLLKDESATCTANVTVSNNNSYYLYSVILDCGEAYKTSLLTDKIKTDNTVVSSGDGLYSSNGSLLFRGEDLNNYVSFAGKTWRIVKINSDNSIRLIQIDGKEKTEWDDRYNSDVDSNNGINNYRVSRIKDYVESVYDNEKEFSTEEKSYIVAQDICLERLAEDSYINEYRTCSDILENQYISLLSASEFVLSSIDSKCDSLDDNECTNYNYLANIDRSFWTITASTAKTDLVYQLSPTPYAIRASMSSTVNVVIHLSSNATYSSGDGSLESPYKINVK